MPKVPEFHNESLMPIIMGSPYRVPDDAYPLYGLGQYINETRALQAYIAEWASGGTKAQNDLAEQATIEAGLGNCNGLLRQATAETVVALIEKFSLESPVILDVGAGAGGSVSPIVWGLPDRIRHNTDIILNDPSKEKLQAAGQLMEAAGVRYQKLVGTDMEVLGSVKPGSVDILIGVASIHHHARIPFESYARVLKEGGFAIFADWHQDIWEHPARVLEFLKRFDWPNKEQGLANWITTYPQALSNPDVNIRLTLADLLAREQITQFWLVYQNIAARADLGPNAIWSLEGHRPKERYIYGMHRAGLHTNTPAIDFLISKGVISKNPHQVSENSSLLQISVGQQYNLSH